MVPKAPRGRWMPPQPQQMPQQPQPNTMPKQMRPTPPQGFGMDKQLGMPPVASDEEFRSLMEMWNRKHGNQM